MKGLGGVERASEIEEVRRAEGAVSGMWRGFVRRPLSGTLDIEGGGFYYIYLKQMSTFSLWLLFSEDAVDVTGKWKREGVKGVLKLYTNGKTLGSGNIAILLRLLDGLNIMNARAYAHGTVDSDVGGRVYYKDDNSSDYIEYTTEVNTRIYRALSMNYDGFILNLTASRFTYSDGIKDKDLVIVPDSKAQSAIIANLGVRTFDMLLRSKGSSLEFLERKSYYMVQTVDEFEIMMQRFFRDAHEAYKEKRALLVGMDTETTGLNMYRLSKGNKDVDHVVSIQLGWKKDEGYLICMDMAYFSNVPDEVVYPLFSKVFGRDNSFGDRLIEIDWCGEHYTFRRDNIRVTAHNAMFDKRAFLCHECNVYFDEDTLIGMYDLAPSLVKGHNGLKEWSRAIWGEETLELSDLFGKGNEDKFRYLQDKKLALVYGCADSDYGRELARVMISKQTRSTRSQYLKYDIPIMNILAKASWRGMNIDSERVVAEGEGVHEDIETLQEFVYHYAFFVYRENKTARIAQLGAILGVDADTNDDVLRELLGKADSEKMFRFDFTPANLKNLLFGVLNYPVVKVGDSGQPSMDKYVLDKLARVQTEHDTGALKQDVVSKHDPSKVLISAKKFNSMQYPIAGVLMTYATLTKEFNAYYKPIMTTDLEGRMFYNFNMAFAATRRILCPGQTMKGSLKSLVVAPKGKLSLCFDASQIEFRLMSSLAYSLKVQELKKTYPGDWEERLHKTAIYEIFEEMQHEEADFHVQTASIMTKTPRHLITPEVRRHYKPVGFGIPYGLSNMSLCEQIYGKVTEETMAETNKLVNEFNKKFPEIIALLETTRDSVFYPVDFDDDVKKWLNLDGVNIGAVYDLVGFEFPFALKELTRKHTARIRRQAGNCIIQGGAAELFRRMLYNFYMATVKAGIEEKIEWFMVVHDELDAVVDDDVDVLELIELIYKNCTLRYKGQIPFFVGIGFGYSWGEAKGDESELPVIMVERMIEARHSNGFSIPCDGRQPVHLLRLKRHYMCDRVEEELEGLFGSDEVVRAGHVWTDEEAERVDKEFVNYVVRSYIGTFLQPEHKGAGLLTQLQDWQAEREVYGFGVKFTDKVGVGVSLGDIREYMGPNKDASGSEGADSVGLGEVMDLDFTYGGDDEGVVGQSGGVEYAADLEVDLGEPDEGTMLRESLRNELLEDVQVDDVEQNEYFGEESLFDPNTDIRDIVADEEVNARAKVSMGLSKMRNDESEFGVNESPTSAFDVFVSKKYMRRHIQKADAAIYILNPIGTEYEGRVAELIKEVRGHTSPGIGQLIIVGEKMRVVADVELQDEFLDTLDRVVCGEIEWDA